MPRFKKNPLDYISSEPLSVEIKPDYQHNNFAKRCNRLTIMINLNAKLDISRLAIHLAKLYPAQKLIPRSRDTLKISVVIPTLNETLILEDNLRAISSLNPHEIIVVDGGSTDSTVSVARRMATLVITSKSGRAPQMNAGAKKSNRRSTPIHACRQ